MGYMATLNQIGNCFKPKYKPKVKGNSIIRALTYFSSLSEPEIEAVYALRCSFAHDYSLSNINKKNPFRQHRFVVCQGSSFIVKLPKIQWDGNYSNPNQDNRTIISIEGLGDLAENIISILIEMANKNELECILEGGHKELLRRYSFYSKP